MKKLLIFVLAMITCVSVLLCSCSKDGEGDGTDTSDVVSSDVGGNGEDTSAPVGDNGDGEDGENGGEDNGDGAETVPEDVESDAANPWGNASEGNDRNWSKNY